MIPEFSNRSVTDAVITDSVKEVAKKIGITRGNYTRFESGEIDYYPADVVDRLAELLSSRTIQILYILADGFCMDAGDTLCQFFFPASVLG